MDFKEMTKKQLERGIAKAAVAEKEAKMLKEAYLEEYLRRGFEGGSSKVGKYEALIYYVKNSVSRVLNTPKVKEFLGDKVEEFLTDKYNVEHYAVKVIDTEKKVN